MDLGLKGKAVLVTGSSRGIGLATARAFGREGASVMLTGRTDRTLEAALAALERDGITVATTVGELTTSEGARAAVERTVGAFGAIDVLVNNVGGSLGSGSFDCVDEPTWAQVLALNLDTAVRCSRHAVAWMKENGGGVILHVGSVYGREYGPSAAYVTAKGALVALAKEMAVDLAKYRIRVNSVAPGSILFEGGSWDRRQKANPEATAEMLRRELPWGRFGTPEEVADALVFLASPRASWVAGACVPIDGAQGRAL